MIIVKQGDIEPAIRQLKKEFERSGLEKQIRRHRYFMKPSEIRRRERWEGIKKSREMERKREGNHAHRVDHLPKKAR